MKKQKNGRWASAALALLFLAGLSLLLYPTVSNAWNTARQTQAVRAYDTEVARLREEDAQRLRREAEDFNRALLDRPSPYALPDELAARYPSTLLTGSGEVMAYLEIPALGVTLPICHGTDGDTLQRAVGHLEWSSLPIGGESAHCVLSGHRGLPSAQLLTNIDRLETGDLFYIQALGERLEYQVDRITVVEPDDFSQLGIEEGKDYVTLLTCTPYGINSHRLLVRGARTGGEAGTAVRPDPANELRVLDPGHGIMEALLAGAVLVCVLLPGGRRKKTGRRERP